MKESANRRFWQKARHPQGATQPEPADLGTCFGMEVMLDQQAYTAPISRGSAGGAPAPATAWWRMFTGRRTRKA